jgi:glutathione S-transferase
MTTLYFSPGACSLFPHIVLHEIGKPFSLVKVHLGAKKTSSGEDYLAINPKGYVPAVKLDSGEVLTEGAVLVQVLADAHPELHLIPPWGTPERIRAMEWLNFTATELHKGFSPLYNPHISDAHKAAVRDRLLLRFGVVARALAENAFVCGPTFSVVDAYVFTILTWARARGIEVPPVVDMYFERVATRPAVRRALDAEAAARLSG